MAPVPPEQAVAWLREAADGLDQAHVSGIVHRDIKLNNILFDTDRTLYIADFALARSLDPGMDGLTTPGHIMGTASYISPEQAMGQPVDGRADQYALGIMAFELLAGQPAGELPFQAVTSLLMLTEHVAEAPPKATKINPQLSRTVDAVLDRVLAKTAPERYPTCSAFVAALEEALGPRQLAPSPLLRPTAPRPQTGTLPQPLPEPAPRRRGLGLLARRPRRNRGARRLPREDAGRPGTVPVGNPDRGADPRPGGDARRGGLRGLRGIPGADPDARPPGFDEQNLERMRVSFVRTFTAGSEAPTSVKLRLVISLKEPVDLPSGPVTLVTAVAQGPGGEKALLPAGISASVSPPAEPGQVKSLEVVFAEEVAQSILADETLQTMTVRVRVGANELETRVQIPPQERKPRASR